MFALEASGDEPTASEVNTKLIIVVIKYYTPNEQSPAGDDLIEVDAHSDKMKIHKKIFDGQYNTK